MWTLRPSELALCACIAFAAVDARADSPPSASGGTTATPDDPLATYRGRFKLGMERYNAGALAEAIGYWEPIYRELGEQRGYRLAYNIGVAYEELGDATRAAERLQSFLSQVDARRARSEVPESIVEREENDARSRMAELVATKGRIHIVPGSSPVAAQVDAGEPRLAGFVAWVAPGEHLVTFGPGTPEAEWRTVAVHAGEMLELAPTPLPAVPPPATETPSKTTPASPQPVPRSTRIEMQYPFSPALVIVAGALTLGAAVAAIALENHASTLHDRFLTDWMATGAISGDDHQSFDNARTQAYVAVGAAVGLAIATAGIASWYFLGASHREVFLTPTVVPERNGASVGVCARF